MRSVRGGRRIRQHLVDGELSIGDVVLAGGEVAACLVVEAVAPGSRRDGQRVQPTDGELRSARPARRAAVHRPADFRGWSVPEILRSGDHGRIERWRRAGTPPDDRPAPRLDRGPRWCDARGSAAVGRVPSPPISLTSPRPKPTKDSPMKATDLIDNDSLRTRHPRLRRVTRSRCTCAPSRATRSADLPGQRDRPPGQRAPGDLHRPQAELRRRCRANVPLHTPTVTKIEVVKRRRTQGQAVLPAAAPGSGPRSARSASSEVSSRRRPSTHRMGRPLASKASSASSPGLTSASTPRATGTFW